MDEGTDRLEQVEIPVHGVLVVEGIETGDRRKFSKGALTWREVPIPLLWQKTTAAGHDGSTVVGRIETITRADDGSLPWTGFMNLTPESDEVTGLVASRDVRGVSVDVDSATLELQHKDGRSFADIGEDEDINEDDVVEVLTTGRICAATVCSIPAFAEAFIALGEPDTTEEAIVAAADAGAAGLPELSEEEAARVSAAAPEEVPDVLDAIADETDDEAKAERLRAVAASMREANNAKQDVPEEASAEFREVSDKERDGLADEGKAMEDGSFPIANVEDLKNAIQSVGRAKDIDAAKRHIKKRAKALDSEDLIPDEWSSMSAGAEFGPTSNPTTQDGPGWLTHPVETDRLRDYWAYGIGAAKIGWGLPGDFNRCRVLLSEYIKPHHLSGYCANRHFDALKRWPGRHGVEDTITAAATAPDDVAPAFTLTASGAPVVPPGDWFANPNLDGPTPLTITKEGRVFGHAAEWETCHVGFPGSCVTPPHSPSEYAYFCGGVLETTDGDIRVGQITFDTGHADLQESSRMAAAHYDNTGVVGADVMAGEDDYGIWVAGALRPGVTDEQIRTLRACRLSGDWRTIAGEMEMVAVLAVNSGGFPIPRPALAASAGRQTAMVAAGVVARPDGVENYTVEEVVSATMARMRAEEESRRVAEEVRATVAAVAADDIARTLATVPDMKESN